MNFQAVRFKRASLGKRLLTEIALVWSDPGVGPRVSLQVKGVIETLAAERAEVSLHVGMTFHMPVQKPLQGEVFRADTAHKLCWVIFAY